MKLAIIDFNRTIYDPETDAPVPGAPELLLRLRAAGYVLVMVSRPEAGRVAHLARYGLEQHFTDMHFVERKSKELFLEIAAAHGSTPRETLVIGDHPHEEMRAGAEAGMQTIWLRRGLFSGLTPEHVPWHTVGMLNEIPELVAL